MRVRLKVNTEQRRALDKLFTALHAVIDAASDVAAAFEDKK